MTTHQDESRLLIRFMYLSVAAAVITIVLKSAAAVITGSVGFLSDALESGVGSVHFLNGTTPHSLLLEVFTNAGIGTMFKQND